MTKKIKLTQGKFTLVDDDDYEKLNKHKWYACYHGKNCYVVRSSPNINGKYHEIRMHRQILGLKYGDGKIADHRNRITLDNRRSNLRIVSKSMNNRNNNGHSHNTSGYPGVCWHKAGKKWMSYISMNNKQIYLGLYESKQDAIEAREQGEIKYWNDS